MGELYRQYRWSYKGREYSYGIEWPREWLDELRALPHDIYDVEDYEYYLENDPFENEMDDFFEDIILQAEGYIDLEDRKEILEYLLCFVQHLNYYKDIGGEYPKYPMETLIDKGGDCEDTAILMSFIAQKLGYECAYLEFSSDGFLGIGRWGHIDLGIAASYEGEFRGTSWSSDGNKYYYTSCNGTGRKIGSYSGNWGNRAKIYPIY